MWTTVANNDLETNKYENKPPDLDPERKITTMLKSDPQKGSMVSKQDLKFAFLGDPKDEYLLDKIIYDNTMYGTIPGDKRVLLAQIYIQYDYDTYTFFWFDPNSLEFWQVEHMSETTYRTLYRLR